MLATVLFTDLVGSTAKAVELGPRWPELLREQIVLPVRFREAAAKVAERSDLVVEVGPGRVLTGLFEAIAPGTPVLSVDTDSASLAAFLRVVGAAFAFGAPITTDALFAGRVVRELPADGVFNFLASPCEAAPEIDGDLAAELAAEKADAAQAAAVESASGGGSSTLDLLRKLREFHVDGFR